MSKNYVVLQSNTPATEKRDFVVLDKNTYSMAPQVKSLAGSTIKQFIHLQTLCYYYSISVVCPENRKDMCDLITKITNDIDDNKLPKRTGQRGRAYIAPNGTMYFYDKDKNLLPSQLTLKLIKQRRPTINSTQAKYVNNMLIQNHKSKLSMQALTNWILPQNVSVDTLIKDLTPLVLSYKCTVNLDKDLKSLILTHDKLHSCIVSENVAQRLMDGTTYVDDKMILRFKPIATIIEEKISTSEVHLEIQTTYHSQY